MIFVELGESAKVPADAILLPTLCRAGVCFARVSTVTQTPRTEMALARAALDGKAADKVQKGRFAARAAKGEDVVLDVPLGKIYSLLIKCRLRGLRAALSFSLTATAAAAAAAAAAVVVCGSLEGVALCNVSLELAQRVVRVVFDVQGDGTGLEGRALAVLVRAGDVCSLEQSLDVLCACFDVLVEAGVACQVPVCLFPCGAHDAFALPHVIPADAALHLPIRTGGKAERKEREREKEKGRRRERKCVETKGE